MEMGKLYKIRFNTGLKFYVGSSKNLYKRWKEHLNDLNKNIHHNSELQEEYNRSSEITIDVLYEGKLEECRELEQLILDSWYDLLYNYSKSSTSCKVPVKNNIREASSERLLGKIKKGKKASDNTKKKMSDSRKGKKPPEKSIENSKKYHSIKVEQYSLDGVLIETFDSVTEAGKRFHHNGQKNISKALSGEQKTAYGFIWKSLGRAEKDNKVFEHRYMNCFITPNQTVSVKISIFGEIHFLGTFDTQKEALQIRNQFIIDNNVEHLIDILEYRGE